MILRISRSGCTHCLKIGCCLGKQPEGLPEQPAKVRQSSRRLISLALLLVQASSLDTDRHVVSEPSDTVGVISGQGGSLPEHLASAAALHVLQHGL